MARHSKDCISASLTIGCATKTVYVIATRKIVGMFQLPNGLKMLAVCVEIYQLWLATVTRNITSYVTVS